MSRQLLRNSKIVIYKGGRSYEFRATASFSTDTTLEVTSGRRKTLFNKGTRQYAIASRISPSSITLSTLLTDTYMEGILFPMAGLVDGGNSFWMPEQIPDTPELFEMRIINKGETFMCSPCFIEAIDISLSKDTPTSLNLQIQAAKVSKDSEYTYIVSDYIQGSPVPAKPVYLGLDYHERNSITQASISYQQICEWRENKNLFNASNKETYSQSSAFVTDVILSATVFANYDTDWSIENIMTTTDLVLSKSFLSLSIEKANIVHNISFGSIYTNRLDISYTEASGSACIKLGE